MTFFIKMLIMTIIVIAPSASSCWTFDKFFKIDRYDTITRQVVDLLSSCVEQYRLDFLTLLTGTDEKIHLPSKLFSLFSVLNIKDLILTEEIVEIPTYIYDPEDSLKIQMVLAMVSSPLTLERFMIEIKALKLSNLYSRYVIIDMETLKRKCEKANEFLRVSWKYDILTSTYVCIDSNNETLIYTYNPYQNWAPKDWEEVRDKTEDGSFNDAWTIYRRKLIKNKTTCSDLNFEKDGTVNGAEIKAIVINVPPTLVIHPKKSGWAKYKGLDGIMMQILAKKINATVQVTVAEDTEETYGFSKKITTSSVFEMIGSGKNDILMNAQYIFKKPQNVSFTYPHISNGVSLLTRYAGYETGPSKILHFMNPKLLIGICFVFVTTTVILAILGGNGVIFACLEVLRIMAGVSVMRMPRRTPLRIYLITVIELFLITGSTFQGSLSSILTSPVPLPNIDTIHDLRKSTHKIYINHEYKIAVLEDNLRERVILTDHWNCTEFVLELENAACAAERARLRKIAFEHNLYVSKHRLTTYYSAYMVRTNWLLRKRLDEILQHLSQVGIINYWQSITTWKYTSKWPAKTTLTKSVKYRSLTLDDLEFAFYILCVGLIVSVVAFIIERLASKKFKIKSEPNVPPLFEYIE